MIKFIKYKSTALIFSGVAIYAMAAFVLAAMFFYIYFANVAVRTLAAAEKTKENIQTLTVRVSEMESKRLSAQDGVSLKNAKALGFVETSEPIFVMKSSKNPGLSFKSN